jgi:hypothetical protein
LKPDGLFCFTCASTGRGEHGTKRTSPQDSYGTIGNLADMSDYYTPLNDINSTPKACYLYHSKETLPINELKRITTEGGCADLNLHRCKNLTEIDLNHVLSLSMQFYTLETKHAFSLRF